MTKGARLALIKSLRNLTVTKFADQLKWLAIQPEIGEYSLSIRDLISPAPGYTSQFCRLQSN
jgi:hypothetical protein